MKLLLCVIVLVIVKALDGSNFRCDYTYMKSTDAYFKYQEIPANWSEARFRCYLEGATLASPLTNKLRNAMVNLTDMHNTDCGIYTGIHATFSSGDYLSVEGTPLSSIPHTWAKGEPDNENNAEDCLIQMPDGTLADVRCNDTFPYICYKKADKNMFINGCGTTDGEYNLDTRTGSCYKFHRIARTWTRAFMTCAAEGGYLVIVNSEKEVQVIKDIYAKITGSMIPGPDIWRASVFVGIHDWNIQRELCEVLRQAGYETFSPGEPNNAAPSQQCGAMYRNGLLDDSWCDRKAPFICEKRPENLTCDEENDKEK